MAAVFALCAWLAPRVLAPVIYLAVLSIYLAEGTLTTALLILADGTAIEGCDGIETKPEREHRTGPPPE